MDGFEGEVRIDIAGLPEGFRASSPLIVQAGHREADGVLLAAADAKQPTAEELAKITVTAKATIAGSEVVKTVNNLGQIKFDKKPKLLVHLEPAELVDRAGHDDPGYAARRAERVRAVGHVQC